MTSSLVVTQIEQVEIQKGKNLNDLGCDADSSVSAHSSLTLLLRSSRMDEETVGYYPLHCDDGVVIARNERNTAVDAIIVLSAPFILPIHKSRTFKRIFLWRNYQVDNLLKRGTSLILTYAAYRGIVYVDYQIMEMENKRLKRELRVSKHSTFTQTFTIPVFNNSVF